MTCGKSASGGYSGGRSAHSPAKGMPKNWGGMKIAGKANTKTLNSPNGSFGSPRVRTSFGRRSGY